MPYRGRARGRSRQTEEDVGAVGPPIPPPPSFSDDSSQVGLAAQKIAGLQISQPTSGITEAPAPYSRRSESGFMPPPRSDSGIAASSPSPAATPELPPRQVREAMPESAGAAAAAATEVEATGAIPKRRESAAPHRGQPPDSRSARSGQSNFIDETIFGGYSKENKKEFMSYVSHDTRGGVTREGESGNQKDKWSEDLPIYANCFPLTDCVGNVHLVQYHVSFDPVQDSTRRRTALLREHIDRFTEEPAQAHAIFDGAVLFLPGTVPLRNDRTEFSRVIPNEGGEPQTITIKKTADLSTQSPTVKQILNRIFRDAQAATGLVLIGRHYFNPDRPTRMPKYDIDIWPGFSTRIDQFDNGVMVSIDTISKVMKRKNVLEQMKMWAEQNEATVRTKAEKEIIGETVLTRYNNKNYVIDGIDWDASPDNVFKKRDGTEVTIRQYYKTTYDMDVSDNQPLLVHRPKPKEQRMRDLQGLEGPIFLIPELCYVTGLGTMRQDMTTMREVAKATRFNPAERVHHIEGLVEGLHANPGAVAELDKLNLRFQPSPVQVQGAKLMPLTEVRQGGQGLRYQRDQADWSRALADSRFNDGVTLDKWHVLLPKRAKASGPNFVHEMTLVGQRVGMRVEKPEYHELQGDAGRDYIQCLERIETGQLIMCILPDDRKDRYDAIKQLLCCNRPIASQLVLHKTTTKEKILRSIATKVLLQINCKLRGSPWDAHLPFKKEGVLMVVGVDTFVDAKTSSKTSCKANGALVASYDAQATKWYSRPLLSSRENVVEGLKKSFRDALLNYRRHNPKLPDRVVIYRDGVGEGQLANVHKNETAAYLGACQDIDPDYNPKLTVIVVTKRVPMRFFLKRGPNEYVNPRPGTMVDATVTKHQSEMYDFYIVSQSTNQGTVSPTHYNIIHDNSGWTMDRHQLLAYKLCHLYYNWAGAIRVPAPCQYAHKLAFLVNQNLHKPPSEVLQDRLWYL